MATVYLAHDLRHDRKVALKALRPDLAAALGRERFLNEIRVTERLDHPHVLTLIDSGESDGALWYALPFARCRTQSRFAVCQLGEFAVYPPLPARDRNRPGRRRIMALGAGAPADDTPHWVIPLQG